MPDLTTITICRILLVTALLLPLAGQAQTDQLYEVELLVFSRPAGAGAEHWDGIPELAYPTRSRFLSYPGEQRSEPSATSIPDRNTSPAASATPGPAQPVPFATLSSGQQQLADKAAAMQRSGRYRILFHEAWIQPMNSQTQALPIILDRSGDGGPWPALQGSIKLYLSRYFYLEANLWLNTQGEYLQGNWRMPAPPRAPMSGARVPLAPTQSSLQPTSAGAEQFMTESATLEYPYRHAVHLNQTRRMRSGQIAYIDHPLLGVLIKITPLATGAE
jgi:hypothetical protein